MNARLNDYLIHIGKLAIAGALLEEVVVRWSALLSEPDTDETHAKRLYRGLDSNLDFLMDLVKERISAGSQQQIIDLIEASRVLKNRRNENVHAVWSEMENADTGEFSHVARSRYEKDEKDKLIWLPHTTPTVHELEQFAVDLDKIARDLNECLATLWDLDEEVQRWRATKGF